MEEAENMEVRRRFMRMKEPGGDGSVQVGLELDGDASWMQVPRGSP